MRPLFSIVFAAGLLHGGGDSGEVRTSVQKALPLLQKAGVVFWENTGCISCHHNVLPAMAVAAAREHGFAVDEAAENRMLGIHADYLKLRADRILQGLPPPGGEDTMSYVLFGLAMAQVPGNAGTDAGVRYLRIRQVEDGRWRIRAHRPPLESSAISLTAVTIRVLQAFAPQAQRDQYARSIQRAGRWLTQAEARNTEESTFKVMGLVWSRQDHASVAQAAAAVKESQRPDGGWSQLPTLESDAYATGQALVALEESGMKTSDPVYEHGVTFLLKTQHSDGSWLVKSRSESFQPYFESTFPHGQDQWISAAGTSWAVTALARTRRRVDKQRPLKPAPGNVGQALLPDSE
jgi:squalene-hopene cyclase-like protein